MKSLQVYKVVSLADRILSLEITDTVLTGAFGPKVNREYQQATGLTHGKEVYIIPATQSPMPAQVRIDTMSGFAI